MTEFIQLLVLGMATGGFYTISALGVVVVFRSSGIVNFASGGVAMVGGYLEWKFADSMGWPHPLAVLAAVVASALLNLLVYLLAVRPLGLASTLAKVIATLAVLVSLQQAVLLVFGGLPKVPTAYLPQQSVSVGPIKVGADSLIILAVTVVLTTGLWALYRFSSMGLATSALSESPRSLAALGWSIPALRAANWAIGGAVLGLAGAGLGPILQLTPGNFTSLLVPTLACAMLGGLRSFSLTLVGGLMIGAAQAEATRYITWNGVGDALPFLIIITVLVVRGRSLPLRSYVQERLPRAGTGEIRISRIALLAVAAVVVSAFVSDNWIIGATISLFSAILLLSQVVITGYAGQLSLAQLTMGGVGAIVAARTAASFNTPFLLSVLIGMVAVIPVSILVGVPSLRARGVSLAIATLGFAVAINSTVLTNSSLNGGVNGLTLQSPTLFGLSIDATVYPRRYFLVTLAVFGILAVGVANLRRGRSGRRMLAVRNNERAATALGINVTGAKLYAFVVAGVIAGAGGTLLVLSEALPQFGNFDPLSGLTNLINSVLGGIGYIGGAALGGLFNGDGLPNAILLPVVGQWTWWTNFFPLALGVLVVVQLIGNPDGIADVLANGPQDRAKRPRKFLRRPVPATGVAGTDADEVADRPAADPAPALDPTPDPEAVGSRSWVPVAWPSVRRRQRVEQRRRAYAKALTDAAAAPHQPRGATLVVNDIRVTFGTVVAVDGVSFEVRPGEVLSVIGPNGAGKTTLMDAITGFVPMRGTICLDGANLEGAPAHRRARAGIARSFQSLELLEDMTVMDNLRCAADQQDGASLLLDLVRPDRGGLTGATAAAVEHFGLADKIHRMPTELGYGDRRLVAIARAVASGPSVLLLDEPAAGLSEHERTKVAQIITMLAKEWNIAVVLIEHDVALVRRVSDRVIALDFGRPIAAGPPADVLARPDVIAAYLGTDDDTTMPVPHANGFRAPLDVATTPRLG